MRTSTRMTISLNLEMTSLNREMKKMTEILIQVKMTMTISMMMNPVMKTNNDRSSYWRLVFFHQSNPFNHHLFVDGFEHIVDGKCRCGDSSERFHLYAGFPHRSNGRSNVLLHLRSFVSRQRPHQLGIGWQRGIKSAVRFVPQIRLTEQ